MAIKVSEYEGVLKSISLIAFLFLNIFFRTVSVIKHIPVKVKKQL